MTSSFASGFSEAPDAAQAARETGTQLKGATASLGIVYVSAVFAAEIDKIVEILKATTGVEAWTGAAGMGVIVGEKEIFDGPAVAAMLLDLPEDAIQPFGPIESAPALRAAIGQAKTFGGDIGTALGLIHIDPTGDPDGNGVANMPGTLAREGGLYLVGGLCSGREDMPAIASNGGASGAATGALISLEAGVAAGVSQGCAPIGPPRTIETSGIGVLAKLDDLTAVEALFEDLQLPPDAPTSLIRQELNGLHIALPIPGADKRDYVVRNLTGLDIEQGLIGIAEAAEDGATAFFCRRDAKSAALDLKEMADGAVKRLGAPPRGALYVSCLARGPNLFGPNGEEVAIVKSAVGADCPIVGFFANGEIAHDRLYGYTGVLALFR